MLPRVINEKSVQPFKFWFNGSLQDGMHFENELYYRLKHQALDNRSKLYQLTCKLAQQGADVVFTVGEAECSLWASLRNQKVAAIALSERISLPSSSQIN